MALSLASNAVRARASRSVTRCLSSISAVGAARGASNPGKVVSSQPLVSRKVGMASARSAVVRAVGRQQWRMRCSSSTATRRRGLFASAFQPATHPMRGPGRPAQFTTTSSMGRKVLQGVWVPRGVSQTRQMSTAAPKAQKPLFDKILIANRGEIACRIIKTAKKMGIKTVAVYSEPDEHSKHVMLADEAVCIGPAASAQSYLVIDKIIQACLQTGAQAVHPGYGFLSEREAFCDALDKHGIVFIGPKVHAMRQMGLKIESKIIAREAKVNLIPGFIGEVKDDEEAIKISKEIGYPVMIKASAGGGGKGMRVAWNDEQVREGYRMSKAEAAKSFGQDTILVEKFIDNPRHIEIQVLCDSHGNGVYLNERECSIQRRNQKVIEEAPSTFLDAETRKRMGEQAVALAHAVQYQSAGTVEFLVDGQRNFYFLEMNTRLQVEHPITEEITGVDIVEQMIRVAAGEKLSFKQEDIGINGWAFESRVYAEDPLRGFLPSIGVLKQYSEPTDIAVEENELVRCDSGILPGSDISMHYDPMICKLVTHAPTRDAALQLMRRALDNYVIRGVNHNICFLRAVCDHPRFISGDISTKFLEEEYPNGFTSPSPAQAVKELVCGAAIVHATHLERRHSFDENSGTTKSFREGGSLDLQQDRLEMLIMRMHDETSNDELVYEVSMVPPSLMQWDDSGDSNTYVAFRPAGDPEAAWEEVELSSDYVFGDLLCRLRIDEEEHTLQFIGSGPYSYKLQHAGSNYSISIMTPEEDTLARKLPKKQVLDTSKLVICPMPGSIISVNVQPGDKVVMGQEVAVVEAMKMQNMLRAERNGTVKSVNVKAGDTVAADEILIEFM